MPNFDAASHLSEVVGLKNDIVHKVFSCPECRTEVTISRWQAAGELPILCARCNSRYQVRGDQLVDVNHPTEYHPERWEQGRAVPDPHGYRVLVGLDAAQKAAPLPKDSFVLVMHPELAPKPAPAAPKPAAPAAPAEAPKAEG